MIIKVLLMMLLSKISCIWCRPAENFSFTNINQIQQTHYNNQDYFNYNLPMLGVDMDYSEQLAMSDQVALDVRNNPDKKFNTPPQQVLQNKTILRRLPKPPKPKRQPLNRTAIISLLG